MRLRSHTNILFAINQTKIFHNFIQFIRLILQMNVCV